MTERAQPKRRPERKVPKRFPSGKKVGRPSEYNPKFAQAARKLCELGATDADLAKAFSTTTTTIRNWATTYSEFLGALKLGKEAYDGLVERSLAARAMGYTFDAVEIKVVEGRVVKVPVRKHVPPDTTACIFWLKNRRPEQWRDVNRFEHTGRDGGPVEVKDDARRTIERRITGIASRLAAEEGPKVLN